MNPVFKNQKKHILKKKSEKTFFPNIFCREFPTQNIDLKFLVRNLGLTSSVRFGSFNGLPYQLIEFDLFSD